MAPGAHDSRVAYLTEVASRLLEGCRVAAHDGTVLYTPDASGHYRALWTRDFAMMVEGAGDLLPPGHVEGCIRYLLAGQREDGVIPDRVRADGVGVYAAGPDGNPVGRENLDNAAFLVFAVDEHLRRADPARAANLFREWGPMLARGLSTVPRTSRGLVFNDPDDPHSPFGFTDTVAKTGELFVESLLYWSACRRMRAWLRETGDRARSGEFARRASLVEKNLGALWDSRRGAFVAATRDCRQVDVFGNAMAVALEFPLGPLHDRLTGFLAGGYDRYMRLGQVRHLLRGEHWQRLLVPVPPEEYQNGAYWASATGWVMLALAQTRPDLAQRTLDDVVGDFRENGVWECVNEGYRKCEGYVISATSPLGAARQLLAG